MPDQIDAKSTTHSIGHPKAKGALEGKREWKGKGNGMIHFPSLNETNPFQCWKDLEGNAC